MSANHGLLLPLIAIILTVACLAACGLGPAPTPFPASMCRPTLTNTDLARRTQISESPSLVELQRLVHPIDAGVVRSVCFSQEIGPDCVDVQYTVTAPAGGDPLCLHNPVRGKIIWLDGSPGFDYTFEIMPDGADYFVWLHVMLTGNALAPGLKLGQNIEAGYTYEQGATLATCFDRAGDLRLTMGVARCKNRADAGTVRCAVAAGRTYLDPREPQWWAGGLPQYLGEKG